MGVNCGLMSVCKLIQELIVTRLQQVYIGNYSYYFFLFDHFAQGALVCTLASPSCEGEGRD